MHAIYGRVSTVSEDQAHALEQQLSRLRRRAEDLEGPVTEFVDVMSGTRDDRPQLQKMLAQCAEGKLKTVVVTRLDRMSRSTIHGAKLLRRFNQENWPNLICLDQTIDLDSATGRFHASLLMNLAQMESELIGERVHHGNMYNRKQMKPSAAKPPFGYRYTEGKTNYALDPKTARKAREVIEYFLAHEDTRGAFRFQKKFAQPPFRSVEGFRRWLLNPALTGSRIYGTFKTVTDDEGNKRRLIHAAGVVDEIHPGTHPALMTLAELETAQAIMNRNKKSRTRPVAPRRARALSGLVFCRDCNELMTYHRWKRNGPDDLRCRNPECKTRPHQAIPELTVRNAALDHLAANVELLAQAGMAEELLHRNLLDPEIQRLEAQIRQLVLSDDPDVAPAIEVKRERLSRLMDDSTSRCAFSFSQAVTALNEPEVWAELTSNEEKLRAFFCQWISRIVISDRAISSIQLRIEGKNT